MSSQNYVTLAALMLIMMLFIPAKAQSQVVNATGNATEASTQLIYYYDQTFIPSEFLSSNPIPEFADSHIQVTNTNDTSGVWIHVQIFRNFNAGTPENPSIVLCDERNFIDFLTPNDTHVYSLDEPNFPKNIGETEGAPGESTAIDVRGTKGFVVITPVVSEADLSAISFDYLVGNTSDSYDALRFRLNAMGRSAYDFATGERVPTGTPLDGITNGFELLQPDELIFNFAGDGEDSYVDIIGIVFRDVYGAPGLLGYQVEPAEATWTTFIFDFKESPTSCGIRNIACFSTLGLNNDFRQANRELSQLWGHPTGDLLCAGSNTPQYAPDGANFSSEFDHFGWTRIFVSNVNDFENHLGLVYQLEMPGAKWMNTNK